MSETKAGSFKVFSKVFQGLFEPAKESSVQFVRWQGMDQIRKLYALEPKNLDFHWSLLATLSRLQTIILLHQVLKICARNSSKSQGSPVVAEFIGRFAGNIARRASEMFCSLRGGHSKVMMFEADCIRQVCISCGKRSPGWPLDKPHYHRT